MDLWYLLLLSCRFQGEAAHWLVNGGAKTKRRKEKQKNSSTVNSKPSRAS